MREGEWLMCVPKGEAAELYGIGGEGRSSLAH